MVCPRTSSSELPALEACGDDSEAGPSRALYVFETSMGIHSVVSRVAPLVPVSPLLHSWTSIPDPPPPRS